MSRKLVVRRRARLEVDDAAQRYERERPALGDEFVHELDQLPVRVQEAPGQFPAVSDDVTRGLMRRFSFGVYFVAEERHVGVLQSCIVLPVVRLHRHPDAWKRPRGKAG